MKIRHRLRLPLHCPVMFASERYVGEGTLIDLGVPGCAIQSEVGPLPTEYLSLHILSADEEGSFKVQLAKVRWADSKRFGVEFLSFSDGQALTVQRLFRAFERPRREQECRLRESSTPGR
jgi:hypothetical protein